MRFDNPIVNHKFTKFNDIADHPELSKEYRNLRKIDITPLRKSFKEKKIDKFNSYLDQITNNTIKDVKICDKEKLESKKFRNKLNQYFKIYIDFKVRSKIIDDIIFKNLYTNGYHVTNINLSNILNKDIDKKYAELCKRKDWIPPPGTHDRWLELNKESVKKIDKEFRQKGLIKASEAYYSKKMRVTRVRMTVHRPTDQAWKQFLYDCKTTTRHTGLHIDPLEGVTKAMVYLDNVNEQTGPTSFLPKSNRYVYDPLQSLFARSIVAGSWCHNIFSRRAIFRLPKQLRVTTEIGRLIKDNSLIAKYLDRNLFKFTSDFGNTLLFDPGAGIHTGGIVKKGERIALMVVIDG